ncbi:AsmA family protein [Labrys sp. LIt4]|uniref:AsmA family protein n=1 Tax=Labrys sp. LIt4 TaxID=2821355 RepID=UPI001ADF37E3|nr:AsmA family protein [Labrys sp. LIt4]MBP0577985.1 AsmA family protein [Labrys sp. LIt4]
MKRIGLFLAAIAAALLAVVLTVPWMTPESVLRDTFTREIVALTGRTPVIEGQVHLAWAPLPTLMIEKVTIPGAEGLPPLLVADKMQGTLRLAPLVIGRIEISGLMLKRASIGLTAGKNGARSWEFKEGVLAEAAAGRFDKPMPVKTIRLVDGTIRYDDSALGRVTSVSVDDVTFAWAGRSDAMSAAGVINWRDREAEIAVALADPASLIAGGKSDMRARIKGDTLNLAASGTLDGEGRLDGKVSASGTSLRDTLRWLGFGLPAGRSLAAYDLQSPLTLDHSAISLNEVQLSLDGNEAEGSLTVEFGKERPKVSGTLAADTLDLSAYSNELHLADGRPRKWRADHISINSLLVSDLDLRISAGETTIDKVRLGRAAATVSTRNGQLELALSEAVAYGGTLKGTIALKPSDKMTELAAAASFEGVDMGGALGDLFGFRRLEGTGTGTMAVSGTGASIADLSRSLQGRADISVAGGSLVGIDLASLMQKIERRPLSARFESSYGGRTTFDLAKASFKITDGMAKTADCRMENGSLSVSLTGDANIALRSLDMAGVANWSDADAANPFRLPFRVYGGWEVPVVEPDTEALIRRSGAAAPLLRSFIRPGRDVTQDTGKTPPASAAQ